MQLLTVLTLVLTLVSPGIAHASTPKPDSITWQSWHMLTEHGLDSYDSDVFFKLHDLQDIGFWTKTDILNLYGLLRESVVGDGSGMGEHSHGEETITKESKNHVVDSILKMMDTNSDGQISIQEFRDFTKNGGLLPDFGYGQGHHLDFESEYEEHHWKEYHMKDDPDVLIKHKEDIEHELLHHEHEIEETHDKSGVRDITGSWMSKVREFNIPNRYRKY